MIDVRVADMIRDAGPDDRAVLVEALAREIRENPCDKWEGEQSLLWLVAHTASAGDRERMFDWLEELVLVLAECAR